jgi:hypothetical protein
MLGSQRRLLCVLGRCGRRRRGNRGFKVRRTEKVLRAELRQELGESPHPHDFYLFLMITL